MSRRVVIATLAVIALVALLVPLLSSLAHAAPTAGAIGRFGSYSPGATAVTYDEEQVPVGARASVLAFPSPFGGTVVILAVSGLLPERDYGAHVHVNGCGPAGADAGPHFQNSADPVQPSTDPAYANPDNEVWLDFTTDATGAGRAVAHVPWRFGDRPAGSVVLHAEHTDTAPGHAGIAGDRLACLTVDF